MQYYKLTVPIPKQPWLWIRFRITTILLVIVIISMALAWRRDHAQLSNEIYQLSNPGPHYEAAQATGPPNSRVGDSPTAWCHLTADDQKEWIVLEYDQGVVPKAIVVHANYNPGAVRRVSHFPKFGLEKTLWEGTDPTPPTNASGVPGLPTTAGIKTNRIKVYLDSPAVSSWNEIDAVGIVHGDNNETIWAKRATASSTWGYSRYDTQLGGITVLR